MGEEGWPNGLTDVQTDETPERGMDVRIYEYASKLEGRDLNVLGQNSGNAECPGVGFSTGRLGEWMEAVGGGSL
jgi:hypothetical protein